MARITITRGVPYDLTIVIKQPENSVPGELTDTAVATLYIMSKGNGENNQLLNLPMVQIGDPIDGKFQANLTAQDTILLPFELGFEEDGELFRDTCRGAVTIEDINNTNPGLKHINANLPNIYVSDIGL